MVERGLEPPDEFYQQPELIEADLPFWNAFNDLGSERQLGMTVGPIPWSKVMDYADRYDMDAELLWMIIRRVDGEYLRMLSLKNQDDEKVRDQADMKDPKSVKRLLDGFNQRRRQQGSMSGKK